MNQMILNSSQENETSHVNYDVDNKTICNTEVLKPNLFHYNDVYILVKGDIVATKHNIPTPVAIKNCTI